MRRITTINAVCSDPTFRAFRQKHSKLWKPLEKLATANRRRNWADAANRKRNFTSSTVFRDNGLKAFEMITAATYQLPDFIREDVRSAMFLAAAEGRLKPCDAVKRVREFVTAHNRQFSKFVPGGGGIMRSLDEQVYDDGPTRLVDTVTHGLWQ